MKEILAGIIFLGFIGLMTFACLEQGKKDQFKKWAKMSINFERKHIIEREAKINAIDPDLIRAIIWVESQGNSEAISSTGCRGLTQINRGNSEKFGYAHADMHKDEIALPITGRLIKESIDFYHSPMAASIRKHESLEEWILREYSKGRSSAMRNIFIGKEYAKIALMVYRAIKDRSYQITLKNKLVKIDIAKINGEA